MPNLKRNLIKVTIRLYEDQRKDLRKVFGRNYNLIIRELIDEKLTESKGDKIKKALPRKMNQVKLHAARLESKLKSVTKDFEKLKKQFFESN